MQVSHQDPFAGAPVRLRAAPRGTVRARRPAEPVAPVAPVEPVEEAGWVDVPTAAALLNVSERRVRDMARAEAIPARKNAAGAWRIRVSG